MRGGCGLLQMGGVMFCTQCGAELPVGSTRCSRCGKEVSTRRGTSARVEQSLTLFDSRLACLAAGLFMLGGFLVVALGARALDNISLTPYGVAGAIAGAIVAVLIMVAFGLDSIIVGVVVVIRVIGIKSKSLAGETSFSRLLRLGVLTTALGVIVVLFEATVFGTRPSPDNVFLGGCYVVLRAMAPLARLGLLFIAPATAVTGILALREGWKGRG